jgi:PKD repeat protein
MSSLKKFHFFWLCFILLTLLSISTDAQQLGGKNKVYLIGQVTNKVNGGPVKNLEMIVLSDTVYNPGFIYHSTLYTDNEGYFYDTISTYLNKGALVIYTYDYLYDYHDTTVYFRFNWSEENFLFPNFQLPIEPPQIIYQANFYYQKNPSGQNPSEYQFFDITNSTGIISYEWDFGDGSFSSEMNPLHIYNSTGIYRVMLTVTIQTSPNTDPFESSLVKIINVTVKNYFYMGGHVMAGYFPIDHGEAYLYKIESKEMMLIDTALFNDSLGFYLFPQVIEGDYIVKADLSPNSIHFNHFMTTYYSNKPLWTEADTIFHYTNNCEYDIELIPVTQVFSGEGGVSGIIMYGSDSYKGKNDPAGNVEILLLNEDFEPVFCNHSSESGAFEFENLNFDNYYIHAEVTGKYTIPVKVSLSQSNPEIDNITLTIGSYSVNGNVNAIVENGWDKNIGLPYPNPVADVLYLDCELNFSDYASVTVFNISGQQIKGFKLNDKGALTSVQIDTGDLTPGHYFIRIHQENQEVFRKFIKE